MLIYFGGILKSRKANGIFSNWFSVAILRSVQNLVYSELCPSDGSTENWTRENCKCVTEQTVISINHGEQSLIFSWKLENSWKCSGFSSSKYCNVCFEENLTLIPLVNLTVFSLCICILKRNADSFQHLLHFTASLQFSRC